jgi:uncharacterized protein YccT (UPF0319 family)
LTAKGVAVVTAAAVAAVVTAVAIAAIEVVVVAGDKTTKGILAGAFLVLPLDSRLRFK